MSQIRHFCKRQKIVAPEALRVLPLVVAVFIETGKGDVVTRGVLGSVLPNRGFDAANSDFINGFSG